MVAFGKLSAISRGKILLNEQARKMKFLKHSLSLHQLLFQTVKCIEKVLSSTSFLKSFQCPCLISHSAHFIHYMFLQITLLSIQTPAFTQISLLSPITSPVLQCCLISLANTLSWNTQAILTVLTFSNLSFSLIPYYHK